MKERSAKDSLAAGATGAEVDIAPKYNRSVSRTPNTPKAYERQAKALLATGAPNAAMGVVPNNHSALVCLGDIQSARRAAFFCAGLAGGFRPLFNLYAKSPLLRGIFASSTMRPLARDPRVLIGLPLPLGYGLDGRLLLARRGRVYV